MTAQIVLPDVLALIIDLPEHTYGMLPLNAQQRLVWHYAPVRAS